MVGCAVCVRFVEWSDRGLVASGASDLINRKLLGWLGRLIRI